MPCTDWVRIIPACARGLIQIVYIHDVWSVEDYKLINSQHFILNIRAKMVLTRAEQSCLFPNPQSTFYQKLRVHVSAAATLSINSAFGAKKFITSAKWSGANSNSAFPICAIPPNEFHRRLIFAHSEWDICGAGKFEPKWNFTPTHYWCQLVLELRRRKQTEINYF